MLSKGPVTPPTPSSYEGPSEVNRSSCGDLFKDVSNFVCVNTHLYICMCTTCTQEPSRGEKVSGPSERKLL